MRIQLNTDDPIEKATVDHVEAAIESSVTRLARERIARVEIHVRDASGSEGSQPQKHCKLEARFEGQRPIAATCQAAVVHQAVRGAAGKLRTALEQGVNDKRAGG